MLKECKHCGVEFEVSEEDLAFYDRVSPIFGGKKFQIPVPDLCPEDRLKQRLVWRNERNLYRNKCAKTGQSLVSWISPEKPQKVFKNSEWWKEDWNALDYGRDIDFSRPFFEQLKELVEEVPWMALLVDNVVNSEYANFCNNLKDCYLLFASNDNEDCMYSSYIWSCNDCTDLLQAFECQLCYECVDVNNCYNCKYSKNCDNSRDLIFCDSLRNCQDCFGCTNLVGKKFCFNNQQLTEEDYRAKVASLGLDSYDNVERTRELFRTHRLKFPVRAVHVVNCEKSTGECIKNSKNLIEGYDVNGAEDCKWVLLADGPVRDCYDVSGVQDLELSYYTVVNGIPASRTLFSAYAWKNSHNVLYSVLCPGSQDCFGVVGLEKGKYCILNKRYGSKEEYEAMVARLIEHMKETGEWGQFLPPSLSPFGYNETMAQDYFPIEKSDSERLGYTWFDGIDSQLSVEGAVDASTLPEKIEDAGDDILNLVIKCEVSGKPFKITPAELKFYKKMRIPLPRKHHDERHKLRLEMRNAPRLHKRKCEKCGAAVESTYGSDKAEKIYCEQCYLKELY